MKKLLILFSAAALFAACNNEEQTAAAAKNTDLIQQNLKGKVKTLDETSSTVDSTGASKADSTSNSSEFDEKGYQTAYIAKDINGKTKEHQTLARFDNGQLKELVIKNGDGKQTTKWEITLDSSGKYKEAKVYDSTGKVSSVWKELAENEFGQVTKGNEYKQDGTLKASFQNDFDNNGHYTGGWGKDSTGKETFRSSIKLNDKGDAAEETRTSATKDSTTTEKFTYKYDSYDEQGNWTQRTTIDEKGKTTKVIKRTYTYYKD
jgi:hypothetical protein